MTSNINLAAGRKTASHLVKYTHHIDGEAHFSQDGKVKTAMRRRSIALASQQGHIFSLLVQGLEGFDEADPLKDVGISPTRAVVNFEMGRPEAVKLVGRWREVRHIRVSHAIESIGPIVKIQNGQRALLLAAPNAGTTQVLAVTCEAIPKLGPEPETMAFYGGFDSAEVVNDLTRETGLLGFIYPASDPEALRKRIGTVDFVPDRLKSYTISQ